MAVPDRKGLRIFRPSTVPTGVCGRPHTPSWHCLPLGCFRIFWSPNFVVETSLCMLLILFQPAQNIACSQANESGLCSLLFFLFPNSQLIPSCRKPCVFKGKCNLCVSRPIFSLFPNVQLIPNCQNHCVFTGKLCMCLSSQFFSIP